MDNAILNEITWKYAQSITEKFDDIYAILFNVKPNLDKPSNKIRTSTRLNKINFSIMRICDQQYFINFDIKEDSENTNHYFDIDFREDAIFADRVIHYNENLLERICDIYPWYNNNLT